jgi:hypothetical protein
VAKTQGERIEELARTVEELARKHDRLAAITEQQITHLAEGMKEVQAAVKDVAKDQQQTAMKSTERTAAVEQRCTALEKLSDRGWQGWLALIGAGLALLVALLKK